MRMPLLAYFVFIGTTLLALLNLSSYALPDIGPPIKTSQLVGLPKVEPRPDAEPLILSTFNFGARKESVDKQLPDNIYAKDISSLKGQNTHLAKHTHLAKRRQTESKDKGAARAHQVAVYSYDAMMSIH
jgi:hypothetical protein